MNNPNVNERTIARPFDTLPPFSGERSEEPFMSLCIGRYYRNNMPVEIKVDSSKAFRPFEMMW